MGSHPTQSIPTQLNGTQANLSHGPGYRNTIIAPRVNGSEIQHPLYQSYFYQGENPRWHKANAWGIRKRRPAPTVPNPSVCGQVPVTHKPGIKLCLLIDAASVNRCAHNFRPHSMVRHRIESPRHDSSVGVAKRNQFLPFRPSLVSALVGCIGIDPGFGAQVNLRLASYRVASARLYTRRHDPTRTFPSYPRFLVVNKKE